MTRQTVADKVRKQFGTDVEREDAEYLAQIRGDDTVETPPVKVPARVDPAATLLDAGERAAKLARNVEHVRAFTALLEEAKAVRTLQALLVEVGDHHEFPQPELAPEELKRRIVAVVHRWAVGEEAGA
jgi:hypothetical protein